MPYAGPHNEDPFHIPNPDPTRHYRWLADDPRRLGGWLRAHGSYPGYQLEPASNAVNLGLADPSYTANPMNRIVVGFNVLASIPIGEYERRVQEGVDAQRDKVTGVKEAFYEKIDSVPGVKVVEGDVQELQDKKAFATRDTPGRVFVGAASHATRTTGRRPPVEDTTGG